MRDLKRILSILCIALFFFVFALFSAGADRECTWIGVEKIVAIGDLHGDYTNFVRILHEVGLIDTDFHWKGGNTHLVQTGDVIDRGPEARAIYDLILRLEEEAIQDGGMVHMLIGNHEEMNITGIAIDQPRYVTLEQFLSFLPDKFREEKENEIKEKHKKNHGHSDDSGLPLDGVIKEFWTDALRNDHRAKNEYIKNFNEEYGKWIIEHNTVIKINDTVFVHGGLSEKYSQMKLKDINKMMRNELNEFRSAIKNKRPLSFKPNIVYASDGPLWYRGLSKENEGRSVASVEEILNNLEARRMVIAHTPQVGSRINLLEHMSRFDGRVWIIDTGISESYGGFLSALIIDDGQISIWEPKDEE